MWGSLLFYDQDPEAKRDVKDFPNILLEQRLDLLDTNPQTLFKFSMFQLPLKFFCLLMLLPPLRISEKYADFKSDRPRFICQLQQQRSSGRG